MSCNTIGFVTREFSELILYKKTQFSIIYKIPYLISITTLGRKEMTCQISKNTVRYSSELRFSKSSFGFVKLTAVEPP